MNKHFTLMLKEYWKTPIAGDIITSPIVDGEVVYLTTFDGKIYAYRHSDGTQLWMKDYHATSAPWIAGEKVFVSMRLDTPASTTPGNQTPSEGQGEIRQADGAGRTINSNTVRQAEYIDPSVQSKSAYHQAQTANDSSVGFATAPAAAKTGQAAANVGQGTVHGLWEYQGSRPVVIAGKNYSAMGDWLQAVDLKTGQVIWRSDFKADQAKIGGHLLSPPAVVNGRIYVGTAQGQVLVMDARTGRTVWKHEAGAPVRFQPAVAGGHIYIGTTGGRLIGINLADPAADGWCMWGGSPAHNSPAQKANPANPKEER